MTLRVSIDGLPAIGKSCLLEHLKHLLGRKSLILPEQLELWRKVGPSGFNLLGGALAASDLEAITNFQHFALYTVLNSERHYNYDDFDFVISERSLRTQKEVFWRALAERGLMKPPTFDTLSYVLETCDDSLFSLEPDVIIYMKDKPENCLERVWKRNRPEEAGYTLEYLSHLHRLQEQYIESIKQNKMAIVHEIAVEDWTELQILDNVEKVYSLLLKLRADHLRRLGVDEEKVAPAENKVTFKI